MSTVYSYDLNGKKLSFSNWISNLSPEETLFSSVLKKEKVNQIMFQWQYDTLNPSGVADHAEVEGFTAIAFPLTPTEQLVNYTQILRKVVKVSDTADSLANYGRGDELTYQMMKAGKELKRDVEWAFLNNKLGVLGDSTTARETAGFSGLVAPLDDSDPATGAVVHKGFTGETPLEVELMDMMYNLYLSGSQADTIMYHPKMAHFFSGLQESSKKRVRMFKDTKLVDLHVSEIVSPWCQRFKLIPNRWMPEDSVYFYNPKDFTQMVLREPKRSPMAKKGSSEKVLLEMEIGLRLANPFAAGVLVRVPKKEVSLVASTSKKVNTVDVSNGATEVEVTANTPVKATYKIDKIFESNGIDDFVDFTVYKDDAMILELKQRPTGVDGEIEIYSAYSAANAGTYKIVTESHNYIDNSYTFKLKTKQP